MNLKTGYLIIVTNLILSYEYEYEYVDVDVEFTCMQYIKL